MFRLDKKVAIITGGASGIGLAISQKFAQQGAIVHIFELDTAKSEREADLINANGGEAYFHGVDISKQREVAKAIKHITKEQQINILVNNAAIAHRGTVEDTTEEDFDKVFNVNVKGAYNCLQALIPHFKEKQGGVILNMSSIAATVGLPNRFAYSMSKGAMNSMTLSIAKDYINEGIRCNSISPARVHTSFVNGFLKKNHAGKEAEMFDKISKLLPIGRMAEPEEIANLALYLCSDEASFITGTDYLIDGGFEKLRG